MEKEEQLQILKDLIQIKSVNSNEVEVAEYIGKLFQKHHISYKIDKFGEDRANLVAEIGSGKTDQVLGFTGHQDTVSVEDPSAWKHDPFKAEIDGDKLFGRGAADMKSGLAAQVITLIDLVDEGIEIDGKIRFIATAGEEYGTPGANRLNEQGVANDLSALVVGEPTNGQVIYAHSGSLNYQIKSIGKAVHSSRPAEGINAITGLSKYIDAEATLFNDAPEDKILGQLQHSITLIKGGEQVNIIPDYAELYGNIRPTESFDNDQVIATIKNEVAKINKDTEFHLEFNLIHNFRPVETEPDNPFITLVDQAAKDNYQDRDVELQIINAATDASVFITSNPKLPVVIMGADESSVAHQTDEYTTLTSYYETVETYESIAKTYFKQ